MEKDTLNCNIMYPCNQCEYTATQADNLKKHEHNNHENGKHSCKQCDYQAKNKKTS